MKKLLSYVRRAVEDYNMIQEGDHIAVGVSGGKDSLTLLCALAALRRFFPKKFTLSALTVTMGYEDMEFDAVAQFCKSLDVDYHIQHTEIARLIFDIRQESNPCSLCANLRRGAVNNMALEIGAKTVALGHHNDDVAETFLLSLFYEGRVNCFEPVTYLDRKGVTAIRPMIYVPEYYIRAFSERNSLPVVKNSCPADGNTKREYIKQLIAREGRENRGFKGRIFTAVQNSCWKKP